MPRVGGARKLLLEGVDIGAADEGAVADDGCDRAVDLALDVLILKLQVGHRHRHRTSSYFRRRKRRAGFPA